MVEIPFEERPVAGSLFELNCLTREHAVERGARVRGESAASTCITTVGAQRATRAVAEARVFVVRDGPRAGNHARHAATLRGAEPRA